jgi:hypothetical protein
MKTVLLLLLAMLAIKTTTTTSATGQEACSKGYIACLDKCVARPTPAMQETCMQTCQTQNNACFSQVYGGPGPNAVTVKQDAAPSSDTPAGDAAALASDQEQPKAKKAAKPAKTAKPRERAERRQH